MSPVSMRQLLEAGVHFGHQTRRWNPKMKRYIFGERNGIYIIDLQQSVALLERAYSTVRDTVSRGGTVLFVGTKRQASEAIEQQAQRVGMPYVSNRWLGGMLTNFSTIKTRLERLDELERMEGDGTMDLLPKKEALRLSREKDKLMYNLGGIRGMERPPDLVWIVDTVKEHIGVDEANRLGIPVVAIVDTNCDPDQIDYPIPGNDDAIRSSALLTRVIADAVAEGHGIRASKTADDVVAEQAAAAAGEQPAAASQTGPEAEPLAEWEIALQREEAARQAQLAGATLTPEEEAALAAREERQRAASDEAEAPAAAEDTGVSQEPTHTSEAPADDAQPEQG